MALVTSAAAGHERGEELKRLMPPPPPRPPGALAPVPTAKAPVVLDEDTYTQHLEAIIERDYFPELPKMANQLEWLRAVNSGDVREMQQAQRNIARRRAAAIAAAAAGAGSATPGAGLGPGATPGLGGHLPFGATPGGAWGRTPGTAVLHTPAMTPMVGTGEGAHASGAAAATAAGGAAAAAAGGAAAAPVNLSLDAFVDRYTSEDNASFQALLEEDNRRKRAKVAHHLNRPTVRDPAHKQLLLEGPPRPAAADPADAKDGGPAPRFSSDEFGSSGQAPMTLLPAPEPPVNNLFYDSSQRPTVPLSVKEASERALGPPKAINKAATRLHAPPEAPPPSAPQEGLAGDAAALAAGVPVGAPMPGNAGGTVGYGAMSTPALHDVMPSPLMTWGELGSTPLRLDDRELLPALDVEGLGIPAFNVQRQPEREATAHRLAAAKAGSGTARSRVAGGATPLLAAMRRNTGSGAAGTSGRAGGATPLVALSPAARQLAAKIKAGSTPKLAGAAGGGGRGLAAGGPGGGGADKQLAASYGGGAAAAGGRVTPLHAHGGHTPRGGAAGAAGVGVRVKTPSVGVGTAALRAGSKRQAGAPSGPGGAGRATAAAFFGGGGTPVAAGAGAGVAPRAAAGSGAGCGAAAAGGGGSVTDDLLKL